MGHMGSKQVYKDLRAKLDKMPVGAPGDTTIYDILRLIYTPEEAEIVSKMPLRFVGLESLARRVEMSPEKLRPKLEAMADKGLLLDINFGKKTMYMIVPTVVGIFEFSMMRIRDDIDQKKLAELIYHYMIEEPDFFGQFDKNTQTTPFRTLIHEEVIPQDYAEILDWERASYLVENAGSWGVGLCHCRHVAHHKGEDCQKFKMDSCLMVGSSVDYMVRHKLAREIDQQEAKALLEETRDAGMVHIADNVRQRPSFICNCCGCCCEVLQGFKKFESFGNTFSSNFEATTDDQACTGCKKCQKACPVDAIEMLEKPRTIKGKRYKRLAQIDRESCIGCGVCAFQCKFDSLKMVARPQRRVTPVNTIARLVTIALEQGKMSELMFDKDKSMTAFMAGTLVDAVLKLPPAKQLLAQEALKSRFVGYMIERSSKSRKKARR
jgi:Pyruvate/2-oxoacid:ferredoxin oxidoreductase delta subunit